MRYDDDRLQESCCSLERCSSLQALIGRVKKKKKTIFTGIYDFYVNTLHGSTHPSYCIIWKYTFFVLTLSEATAT